MNVVIRGLRHFKELRRRSSFDVFRCCSISGRSNDEPRNGFRDMFFDVMLVHRCSFKRGVYNIKRGICSLNGSNLELEKDGNGSLGMYGKNWEE
jgi:hypothetical protein